MPNTIVVQEAAPVAVAANPIAGQIQTVDGLVRKETTHIPHLENHGPRRITAPKLLVRCVSEKALRVRKSAGFVAAL
jgi:hypothetical protein